MEKDRKAVKRVLEKAGYIHVSGWVRRDESAPIRDLIKRRRKEVERIADGETDPDH